MEASLGLKPKSGPPETPLQEINFNGKLPSQSVPNSFRNLESKAQMMEDDDLSMVSPI